MTHDLKVWPEFFDPLLKGEKRFELRKEGDRIFHVGDTLRLREWSRATGYTGRELSMDVTYLFSGPLFGLEHGYVCMSLAPSNQGQNNEVRSDSAAPDGSGLCPSCHNNNATEPHCCPYQSEINHNDDAEYCTCCADCEDGCAMAI